MRNLFLEVAYVGTRYHGFQSQPGKNTIQDKLEEAIGKLSGEKVKVIASGRTDAGVHAKCQPLNFYTDSPIPAEKWCTGLNARLPRDIVVFSAREVPREFHARRSAKRKTYRYSINLGRFPDVFRKDFELHHYGKLDIAEMEKALSSLQGQHDFTSFCSIRTAKEDKVRSLQQVWIERELPAPGQLGPERAAIHIYLTGNGFLYNMVRIIAGTLIQVGEGKKESADMARILQGKNRMLAGPTAPAHALTLWRVEYGETGCDFNLDS